MGPAGEDVLGLHAGAEFEDFDVFGTDHRFEGGEVDHAGAGRAMVAAGELDVVDVEAMQPLEHGFEMHGVIDEAEVVFDLGVAAIVPVTNRVGLKFLEEKSEVGFERNFFEGFAIFDAEL